MARKPASSLQETIETDEEFEHYLETNEDKLICLEVYSEFCGPCLATGNAIRKGKLDIGQDHIAMLRCPADRIKDLARFKDHSEPVFLFIVKKKLARAMFGPNGIDLCRIIEEELQKNAEEAEGIPVERTLYNISEMLPEEAEKQELDMKLEEEYQEAAERLRILTLAARKKRVNERLAQKITNLNYIIFWPHCHDAHYDLYEKWDSLSITVVAREFVQMDAVAAREALYMSDVDPNEACIHALFDGKALLVLFRMTVATDTRDFVKLMRYALYEEIPIPREDIPPEKQSPPIPAYERYASISKTARQVRRDRHNAKLQKLIEEKEEAERLASVQARLAREAAEEEAKEEEQRQKEERMSRVAAGLPADPTLIGEPKPEPVEGELIVGEEDVTETGGTEVTGVTTTITDATPTPAEVVGDELLPAEDVVPEPEIEEVFNSDVEIEGEDFIPAGGLFVPGFYSPANDLSKACGLAYFFPKHLNLDTDTIETEYLPPHVLVIFTVDKRYDVQEVINTYASEILNIGIFVGDDPYKAEHLAYTIKQYDKLIRPRRYFDRLAVMVSRKRSMPLLQLAGLNPMYISFDVTSGERECQTMFPVGYGDDYVEEEEESVIEAEVLETSTIVEEKKAEDEEQKNEEVLAEATEQTRPASLERSRPASLEQVRLASQEALRPASQAPLRPASQEPLRLASQEPLRPASQAPLRPASQAPLRPASQEQLRPASQAPLRPASQAPLRPPSQAPLRPASQEQLRPASQAPLRPASQAPLRPASQEPLRLASQEPLRPASKEPSLSSRRQSQNPIP